MSQPNQVNISVVIPLLNEAESLPELTAWIVRVMQQHGFSYEIIFINDGSTDNSWEVLQELRTKDKAVKAINFRRNYGKSAALHEGFKHAIGEVVITMDADLQDSPEEIPDFYKMIMTDGYDLVSGWKKVRYDNTFTKNIPSKFFNWVTRKASGIPLNDFNCGLKAYKHKVIKSIEVYGEMHRYIPVLAQWAGFRKIGEKVVVHQKRKYGVSKFGMSRFVNGTLDLMSIMFVGKFGKKPMHFFGSIGMVMSLLGIMILVFLGAEKIFMNKYGMTERPIFFIAILMITMGMQMFMTGFIAELIARNASERNAYIIDDILK